MKNSPPIQAITGSLVNLTRAGFVQDECKNQCRNDEATYIIVNS